MIDIKDAARFREHVANGAAIGRLGFDQQQCRHAVTVLR
jgi:hypothetical protein